MFEELYAPLPDAEAYLERIGLAGAEPLPDLEWLDRLIAAQLYRIPFDDMDVWGAGLCPSLAINDLFDKIIRRRRGGYCYELNSLFGSFLKALGFEVYTVIAHIVRAKDYFPIPGHCALVCAIDGQHYFCDVGYGGTVPLGAVPFDGEFRFGHRIVQRGIYHVLEAELEAGAAEAIMMFKDIPAMPVELLPLNYYTSQKEGSGFRENLHLSLRLPNGSVSIRNDHFRYHTCEHLFEAEIKNIEQLKRLASEYFGISPHEIPARELSMGE